MNDQMLIQILRWLMKPKVWRFVVLVSAAVGLLCFALSSSFNHLFGEWTSLKIFLYTIFSLIISLMILYAKTWQNSRSLHFKAHMAFLVLTITTVYSFFSDKVMNGKPDAYSLISCVAFAIMSLNLSKQTHCGFEVDLMYFFLGCLILQLMKIKLLLAIVGIGFSYSLILLGSSFSSIDDSPEDESVRLQDEPLVVIEPDSAPQASVDISGMMQQLMMTCMEVLELENSNLINMLTNRAKDYLQVETDHNYVLDALPSGKINELERIAKLMVVAGYEKECSQVYSRWRKEFLRECLIDKLFELGDINMENEHEVKRKVYSESDNMIDIWIKASVVALRILFPSERRLCDRVFSEFSSTADQCFTEVCLGVEFQLLSFADAVADGRPSARLLFKLLEMFKALRDLIPEIQSLFPDLLVNEAFTVINKLGETSRDLFIKLDKLIFHIPEAKEAATADVKCHPMTVEVMNYLAYACKSWRTQEQILEEYPNGAGSCSFTSQMERIIKLLERKLVDKSKIYEDAASRCIFMMNNRRQIQAMSEDWNMETNFGNDWFQKNREKVQQNMELYQTSSLNEVLELLKLEGIELMASDVEADQLMIEKLNLFTIRFEEIFRVQSTWFVHDKTLRKGIITSLEKILLPAYGIFIGRFQDVLGKHAYEYIQYGMLDIQYRLNNLFLGISNIIPRSNESFSVLELNEPFAI